MEQRTGYRMGNELYRLVTKRHTKTNLSAQLLRHQNGTAAASVVISGRVSVLFLSHITLEIKLFVSSSYKTLVLLVERTYIVCLAFKSNPKCRLKTLTIKQKLY